jgi:hypothetical protein
MILRRIAGLMSLMAAIEICDAADLRYSARMTATDESNPNHLLIAGNNETSDSLYGQVEYTQNGYEVDMRLFGSMDITNYRSEIVPDTTAAQLNTDVLWIVSPSQFELYLGDIYMQTTVDSTSNISPSNQQNINASSIGPNYMIRLNKRGDILLQARINDYYYENVDTDNNRFIGVSRLEYDVSSTVSAATGYEYTIISYDNNIDNIDYVRSDLYVSMNHHKSFYELTALAGGTDINRDRATDLSEPRFALSILNKRSWTTDIRMAYLNDISDASNDVFSIDTHIAQGGSILLSSISNLYKRKTAAFDITKAVSSGQVLVSWRETSANYYDEDALDQIINRLSLVYELNTGSRSRLTTNITRQETEYTNRLVPRTDDDSLISVNYSYSAGRHINLYARVESNSRESTLVLENYDNNRIMLSIEYVSN